MFAAERFQLGANVVKLGSLVLDGVTLPCTGTSVVIIIIIVVMDAPGAVLVVMATGGWVYDVIVPVVVVIVVIWFWNLCNRLSLINYRIYAKQLAASRRLRWLQSSE